MSRSIFLALAALLVGTAFGQQAPTGDTPAARVVSEPERVEIPPATAKAMRYYWSGNILWLANSLHLGGGCSACAIREGRSYATSMGFTPTAGLLMATRSGDIDPSLIDYLAAKEGLDLADVETLLNKKSGLLGISGETGDMRELIDAAKGGNHRAELALDMFCRRIRHYIGAYLAEMDGAEALLFSGGIGENSAEVRRRICAGLSWFGVALDEARNAVQTTTAALARS